MARVHLSEGEEIYVKGSARKPYTIKKSKGVISCSCPAWLNQHLPIQERTCKHINANIDKNDDPIDKALDVFTLMQRGK